MMKILLLIVFSSCIVVYAQRDQWGNSRDQWGGNQQQQQYPNNQQQRVPGQYDRGNDNNQRQQFQSNNVADQGLQCWQYDEIKGETRGYSKLKCNGECCAKSFHPMDPQGTSTHEVRRYCGRAGECPRDPEECLSGVCFCNSHLCNAAAVVRRSSTVFALLIVTMFIAQLL